jgi:hypothetical protein
MGTPLSTRPKFESLRDQGTSWIQLSLEFLMTTWPKIPYDPALRCKSQMAALERELSWNFDLCLALHSVVTAVVGLKNIRTTIAREEIIEKIEMQITTLARSIPSRPSGQITSLFNDFNAFLDLLRQSVLKDMDSNQEQLMQEKLSKFISRSLENYADYDDIIRPFLVFVYLVRHGLRLIALTKIDQPPTTSILQNVFSLSGTPQNDWLAPTRGTDATAIFMHGLKDTVRSFSMKKLLDKNGLNLLLDGLISLWEEAEALDREFNERKSSLYRYKDTDTIETEETLCPNYRHDDWFDVISPSEQVDDNLVDKTNAVADIRSLCSDVVELHEKIMEERYICCYANDCSFLVLSCHAN